MTVKELTQQIYEKYPNVYKLLLVNFYESQDYQYGNYSVLLWDDEKSFYFLYYSEDVDCPECYYNYCYEAEVEEIPFSMLYGLLEEFFLRHEINCLLMVTEMLQSYSLMRAGTPFLISEYIDYYEKFKYQAILKAAEILENKLKENDNG
jgi:hypothetical protein